MAELCEVLAIIRPKKMLETKKALDEIGIKSFTALKVFGRGRQGGVIEDISYKISPEVLEKAKEMKPRFIQKRLVSIVIPKDMVKRVVETLIKVNQTGKHGDGKIFVMPIEESYRIRTGEAGKDSLL